MWNTLKEVHPLSVSFEIELTFNWPTLNISVSLGRFGGNMMSTLR